MDLELFLQSQRLITRRQLLKAMGIGTLAALSSSFPKQLNASELSPSKIDRVILLWFAGGMAQTETFDPKLRTPYEAGMDSRKLLSTFEAIPTSVDGIKISAGLEQIGRVMDRGTIIRSYKPADLGRILHTRHQYHWHTGYVPPQTVAAPHFGAVLARTLGPLNSDVPMFVEIGQNLEVQGGEEIKAFLSAGFLGSDYGPLHIPYPGDAMSHMAAPDGMDKRRFKERYSFFKSLVEQGELREYASDFQRSALLRSLDNAYRLISSPASQAFDLSREPKEIYNLYNTGRFGLGCLLARRLAEAGTRFIEVSTEYIPFDNWDTHNDGYLRTVKLKQQIDRPIARLVLDLEERGLLDRTLVVIATEFGRASGRNPGKHDEAPDIIIQREKQYGMHRHFTGAASVVLFGGGIKRGSVYGQTRDEFPCEIVSDPIGIEDLHATIYHLAGIPPDHSYEVEKRPFYVTRDGKGKAVKELLA